MGGHLFLQIRQGTLQILFVIHPHFQLLSKTLVFPLQLIGSRGDHCDVGSGFLQRTGALLQLLFEIMVFCGQIGRFGTFRLELRGLQFLSEVVGFQGIEIIKGPGGKGSDNCENGKKIGE